MVKSQSKLRSVKPVGHSSVVDRVSSEIRQSVLVGRLPPGESFSITRLCSELGVSHIPVREALQRLESQGLIELRPGRSGVVMPINIKDLKEIYMLRMMIEPKLISLAAPLLSDEDIQILSDALVGMEIEAANPQGDGFWIWHSKFHWQLLNPAINAWSERVLVPLWHGAERYIRLFYIEDNQIEGPMLDHRELYEAAIRRSPDDLGQLLRKHLQENLDLLLGAVLNLGTSSTN